MRRPTVADLVRLAPGGAAPPAPRGLVRLPGETVDETVARLAREGYRDREIGKVMRRSDQWVGLIRRRLGVPPARNLRAELHPRVAARLDPLDERLCRMISLIQQGYDVGQVAADVGMDVEHARVMLGVRGYGFKRVRGSWVPMVDAAPPDPEWRDPKTVAALGTEAGYADIHREARPRLDLRCAHCGRTTDIQTALRPNTPIERLRVAPVSGLLYSISTDDYEPLCPPCHHRQDFAPGTHCTRGHRRVGREPCRACGPMRYFENKIALAEWLQAYWAKAKAGVDGG